MRTQVATRRIKRENRPIGRYLMALQVSQHCSVQLGACTIQCITKQLTWSCEHDPQILIAVATMLSVVLGSTDNDLFIASSTALVSFFQTWLENGQVPERTHGPCSPKSSECAFLATTIVQPESEDQPEIHQTAGATVRLTPTFNCTPNYSQRALCRIKIIAHDL